jgi:hypothetical protein
MIKCSEDCLPCCDFCVYAIHDTYIKDGKKVITGGPTGCYKHLDPEHQEIAEDDAYCEDFHCCLATEYPADALNWSAQ